MVQEAPLGRWGGEDMCMVGETCAIFCVGRKETADKKSPFLVNELGRGDMRIVVELYT